MLSCDDCGSEDRSVAKCLCPFAKDVNNEEIEVKLCDQCYFDRAMEV